MRGVEGFQQAGDKTEKRDRTLSNGSVRNQAVAVGWAAVQQLEAAAAGHQQGKTPSKSCRAPANIWCWPTPVVMMASPFDSSYNTW